VAEPIPDTPRRALLKSAQVCDIVKVQPYVLRSWEKEFPDLGVSRSAGGPRLYRRSDVDRVLRIKQLVFSEGLTLAGARRRLEEERSSSPDDEVDDLPFEDAPRPAAPSVHAKATLDGVKQGLRALLELLDKGTRVVTARPLGENGANSTAQPDARSTLRLPMGDDASGEPPAAKRAKGRRAASRPAAQ
jgi:DNA-binding transcriptional MerR regulator